MDKSRRFRISAHKYWNYLDFFLPSITPGSELDISPQQDFIRVLLKKLDNRTDNNVEYKNDWRKNE